MKIKDEHVENAPESRFVDKQIIQEKKMDDIFNDLNIDDKNIFLKIDTQGYEFQVLEGAEKTLSKINGILVEVSLTELYKGQKSWFEVMKFVQDKGFKLWSVDRGFTNKANGKTLQLDLCFFK